MRTLIQRLSAVAVVLACAHAAAAQTADEVIEKSIAAMGGRANFQKIKTRAMTGTITLGTPAGDIPGTIEIQNAAPNKTRTLIKADLSSLGAGPIQIDQRFDGTTGYVLDSLQGDRPITGNQLDNMKNGAFPHPFLTYKAGPGKASVAGKEKMDGKDAIVVLFEPPSGSQIRSYIDAETYLPIATRVKTNLPQVGDVEQTSHTSDYRDVDGVKIPFKIEVSSAIQSFTIVVTKVEHNTAIDDKLFVKPGQ
jgi:hypothetical protein